MPEFDTPGHADAWCAGHPSTRPLCESLILYYCAEGCMEGCMRDRGGFLSSPQVRGIPFDLPATGRELHEPAVAGHEPGLDEPRLDVDGGFIHTPPCIFAL